MKAKPGILKALQEVLTKELTGINQYFLHSKMCSNWGYGRLAKKSWDESMDEMRHADKVIDRMLFLEGAPNMTRYDKIHTGKDPKAMIEADLALEMGALTVLRDGIATCLEQADHATRELFEHILKDEPPSAHKINRRVPRDLAIIVAKAMDKDPARRFETALEFAEDLARVCAMQPIHARPAGPVLRLQRWMRRNPTAASLRPGNPRLPIWAR